MTRSKPGRVVRVPDDYAETWDGLFVLARREAARRVGADPETISAGEAWREIIEILVQRLCSTENTQLLTVDMKLDMILDRLGVPDEEGPRMRRITEEGQRAMADQERRNRMVREAPTE